MPDLYQEELPKPEAEFINEDPLKNMSQFPKGFLFGFMGGFLCLLIIVGTAVWYIGARTQLATDFLNKKLDTQFALKASSIDLWMETEFSDFQSKLKQNIESFEAEIKNQLKSNDQIVVADLSSMFEKSRTTLVDGFQKDLQQTINSVETTWQKSFETNANALNTLTEESSSFRSMLSNVEKNQQEIAQKVANLTTEAEVQNLLSQAKLAEVTDPNLARLMYLGCLAKSSEKYPVLKKFAEWQTHLIKNDLTEQNLASAQDRVALFADVLDRYLYLGTPQDIENYKEMQAEIEQMNTLLIEAQKAIAEKQRAELNEISAAIRPFDTEKISEYKMLMERAEKMPTLPEVKDEHGKIIQHLEDYINSVAALNMESRQPLQQPPLMEVEVQSKWLQGVALSLSNKDVPLEKRMEDLLFVENQVSSMDADFRNSLKSEFELVQEAGKRIQVENWTKQTESLLANNNFTEDGFLNSATTLIIEGESLLQSTSTDPETMLPVSIYGSLSGGSSKSQLADTESELCKLATAFYQKQLKRIEKNALMLKDPELDDQMVVQIAAAAESQIVQILIEIKSFQKKYPCANDFSELGRKSQQMMQSIQAKAQNAIAEKQRAELNEIRTAMGPFDSGKLYDYKRLLERVEKISPVVVMKDEHSDIIKKLQSYVDSAIAFDMKADQPLQRPPLLETEVQSKWLNDVANRLNNKDVPLENRMQDLVFVQEQINTMDTATRNSFKSEFELVQEAGKRIQVENWMKLSESLLLNKNLTEEDFLNAVSTLIARGQNFLILSSKDSETAPPASIYGSSSTGNCNSYSAEVAPILCKMAREFYQRQMDRVGKNGLVIKELGLDDQIVMQAASAAQSQVLQIYVEMKSFQEKHQCSNAFHEINTKAKEMLKGFANIAEGHQLALLDIQRQKKNRAKDKFLGWVDTQLSGAQSYYNNAEEIATEWTSTWTSNDCQMRLRWSLESLYCIDDNSLRILDGARYSIYSQLREKAEKNYAEDWRYKYSHTNKKDIEDF